MTTPLNRYALDSTVDALKPDLVQLAEAWVQHGDSAAARYVEKRQLRLLLHAAKTEPLLVLANLLRYQIGRKKGFYKDTKSRQRGDKDRVHQRLLRLLQTELPALALAATKDDAASCRPLERALATQLLGFIIREHAYQVAIHSGGET